MSADSVGIDVGALADPGSAIIETIKPATAPSDLGPVLSVAAAAFAAANEDVIGDDRADEEPSVWTDTFPPEAAVAGVLALLAVPVVPVDRPRATIPILPAPPATTAVGTAPAT